MGIFAESVTKYTEKCLPRKREKFVIASEVRNRRCNILRRMQIESNGRSAIEYKNHRGDEIASDFTRRKTKVILKNRYSNRNDLLPVSAVYCVHPPVKPFPWRINNGKITSCEFFTSYFRTGVRTYVGMEIILKCFSNVLIWNVYFISTSIYI